MSAFQSCRASRRPDFPRGVSLVELLVAMAITTGILGSVFLVLTTGQALFTKGKTWMDVQQDARASLERMVRELRMAGTGVPSATQPSVLTAFVTAQANTLAFRANLENATTSLTAAAANGDTTLTVASSARFANGDAVYVTDGARWQLVTITGLGGTSLTVTPAVSYAQGFASGSTVSRLRIITYTLGSGQLTRDGGDGRGPLPLASNVATLAFAYLDSANNTTAVLANIKRVTIALTLSKTPPGHPTQAFSLDADVRPRNL